MEKKTKNVKNGECRKRNTYDRTRYIEQGTYNDRKEYIAILIRKYETLIRNEFLGRSVALNESTTKTRAIETLYQIEICSLNAKYLDQYICEFKKYYYEARLEDYNTQKFYLELFYRKLPRLISETIMEDYYKHIGNTEILPFVDTMGRREEYLREYLLKI